MLEWIGVTSLVDNTYACMGLRSGHDDAPTGGDSARTFDARTPHTISAFEAAAPPPEAAAPLPGQGPAEPFGALRSKPPPRAEPFAALRLKDVPGDKRSARGGSSDDDGRSGRSTPMSRDLQAPVAKVSPLVGAISVDGAFEFTLPHSRGWQGVLKSLMDQQMRMAGISSQDFNINRLMVTDFKGVRLNLYDGQCPDRERFPLVVRYGRM